MPATPGWHAHLPTIRRTLTAMTATPWLDRPAIERLFGLRARQANYLMRSMLRSGMDALDHLKKHGETASRAGDMVTWDERQSFFHLPAFTATAARLDRPFDELELEGNS